MKINNLGILLIIATMFWGAKSCNISHEDSVEGSNIQDVIEIDSFKIQNFIEVNGYSIFTGDYNYCIIQDTIAIKVLPDFDAVSYCGKFGYVLDKADTGSMKNVLTLYVKDLQTGKAIKSSKLKDIIAKSKFEVVLNDIDTFMDSDGLYKERLYSTGKYYFHYDEYIVPNLLTYTGGIVIQTPWQHAEIGKTRYNNGFYLFINHKLELEKFVTLESMNFYSTFFIDYGDSIDFTASAMIHAMYYTRYPMIHTLNEFIDRFLFDFATLEVFSSTPKHTTIIGNLDSTPLPYLSIPEAVIERKFIYLFTSDGRTPIMIVYNPLGGKVAIFKTSSLNILLDDAKRHNAFERFCIKGLSDEYIIVEKCSGKTRERYYRDSEKQNFYAIPRKILDYAD